MTAVKVLPVFSGKIQFWYKLGSNKLKEDSMIKNAEIFHFRLQKTNALV